MATTASDEARLHDRFESPLIVKEEDIVALDKALREFGQDVKWSVRCADQITYSVVASTELAAWENDGRRRMEELCGEARDKEPKQYTKASVEIRRQAWGGNVTVYADGSARKVAAFGRSCRERLRSMRPSYWMIYNLELSIWLAGVLYLVIWVCVAGLFVTMAQRLELASWVITVIVGAVSLGLPGPVLGAIARLRQFLFPFVVFAVGDEKRVLESSGARTVVKAVVWTLLVGLAMKVAAGYILQLLERK